MLVFFSFFLFLFLYFFNISKPTRNPYSISYLEILILIIAASVLRNLEELRRALSVDPVSDNPADRTSQNNDDPVLDNPVPDNPVPDNPADRTSQNNDDGTAISQIQQMSNIGMAADGVGHGVASAANERGAMRQQQNAQHKVDAIRNQHSIM